MDKLFTLIHLQRIALEAKSKQQFIHIALNETLKLISYDIALFWEAKGKHGCRLEDVSGNARIDKNGSYALNLENFIKKQNKLKNKKTNKASAKNNEPQEKQKKSEELLSVQPLKASEIDFLQKNKDPAIQKKQYLLLRFQTQKEGLLGGLWIERQKSFDEAELQILEEIAASYASASALFLLRKKQSFIGSITHINKSKFFLLLLFVLLAFFPVRLTITAPAEIIAQSPKVITAPYDGILEKIKIHPGDKVKRKSALAEMEKINLQGQLDKTKQDLKIAQSMLSRLKRESLSNPEKKTEIKQLEIEIESKEIEYNYALSLFEKSTILSPATGIAIFADAHSLEGKPVQTGEKIMMIANPKNIELLIRAPVEAMIPVSDNAPIQFFLNVAPLKPYEAKVLSMGYQASPDPDGLLSYKIRGSLPKNLLENNPDTIEETLRVGWKGTAKIKGPWSILSYAILRRPLVNLRTFLGI